MVFDELQTQHSLDDGQMDMRTTIYPLHFVVGYNNKVADFYTNVIIKV